MTPQDPEEPQVTLTITEALPKDVGRGIARIDPKDIEALDAEIGDIVQIAGKRATVAKLMPAYMEARGKRTIQVDGIVRENCQAGIGDKVRVRKTQHRDARTIVLEPLQQVRAAAGDARYIATVLEGLPLVQGDRVRADLFGSASADFIVAEAVPRGPVLVRAATKIRLRRAVEAGVARPGVSYEDIGGLEREIQRVREMIELPLRYPEVFERLGIEAPKGVLLHGPPGCGKTLLARAVANETDAHFLHLSGPEVMAKFYGESEARLRSIFEEASKRAPSIVFIDEIDAIAPKRAEVIGEVEKRVVAQLLALMDGLEARGQVMVIGATNIPNVLDPALRRPGRFDREIALGVPNKLGRLTILEIHTRGMPLGKEVDLERLSQITHGFVGADLEALCKEAAMLALRRILPELQYDLSHIPYETLAQLEISMDDFLGARGEIEPSAVREVFVEVPNVRWDEVGGLDGVKQQLVEAVEWPVKYGSLLAYANVEPPGGILLHGPPGTGKTLIVKALATETEVNFIPVKGPELMSKWVGESEKGVREVFRKARQVAPCIVFFDEIDALVPTRGGGGADTTHVTERVISQMLTEIDGLEELKGVTIVGATNRLDIVDPALLRAGRFDTLLELKLPDAKTRGTILCIHTKDKPVGKNVDLARLARETGGLTGADLEAICTKATMLALREFIAAREGEIGEDYTSLSVRPEHFDKALVLVKQEAQERAQAQGQGDEEDGITYV